MGEVVTTKIGDRQFAEHVIKDRGRHLDRIVARHHARRLKAGEGEGFDIFLKRHAILKADGNGNREVVHQRAEGGTFLVHVDEDFTEFAVFIFTGTQVNLVTANGGLLGVAFAAARKGTTVATDDAFDDFFDNLLRCCRCLGGGWLISVIVFFNQGGAERLAEFRAITIQRVCFHPKTPRQHVSVFAILNVGAAWHVDGFGNRTGDERLGRGHHADVTFSRQITFADTATRICTIKDRQVFVAQMRGLFERHRTTDIGVGQFDLFAIKAKGGEHVKVHAVDLFGIETKLIDAEVIAKGVFVKYEFDVKCVFKRTFDLGNRIIVKALGLEVIMGDGR